METGKSQKITQYTGPYYIRNQTVFEVAHSEYSAFKPNTFVSLVQYDSITQ